MSKTKEYMKIYMRQYWKDNPEKYELHKLRMARKKLPYSPKKYKEQIEEAKSLKVCCKCFKNPVEDGYSWCKVCRDKRNAYWKKKRINAKMNLFCVKCYKRRPMPNTFMCLECREKTNEYQKKRLKSKPSINEWVIE